MGWLQRMMWGVLGAAVTMLTRKVANTTMRDAAGMPVLARMTQRNQSVAVMMSLAISSGVVLALSDVLRESRKHAAQTT